jgi:adenosine deaminase
MTRMVAAHVPVEICLTSNVFSHSIASPALHPFVVAHREQAHPVCFCTDDPGVFETTLSRELSIAEDVCGISRPDLERVVLSSVDFSFAPTHVKHSLRSAMERVHDQQ